MKKMNKHLKSALYWLLGGTFLSFLGGIFVALYSHKNDLDDDDTREELKRECIILGTFYVILAILGIANTLLVNVFQISSWITPVGFRYTWSNLWNLFYSVVNGTLIISRSIIVIYNIIKHYKLSKNDKVVEKTAEQKDASKKKALYLTKNIMSITVCALALIAILTVFMVSVLNGEKENISLYTVYQNQMKDIVKDEFIETKEKFMILFALVAYIIGSVLTGIFALVGVVKSGKNIFKKSDVSTTKVTYLTITTLLATAFISLQASGVVGMQYPNHTSVGYGVRLSVIAYIAVIAGFIYHIAMNAITSYEANNKVKEHNYKAVVFNTINFVLVLAVALIACNGIYKINSSDLNISGLPSSLIVNVNYFAIYELAVAVSVDKIKVVSIIAFFITNILLMVIPYVLFSNKLNAEKQNKKAKLSSIIISVSMIVLLILTIVEKILIGKESAFESLSEIMKISIGFITGVVLSVLCVVNSVIANKVLAKDNTVEPKPVVEAAPAQEEVVEETKVQDETEVKEDNTNQE